MNNENLKGKQEFSRLMGVSPSYVTALIKAGRLVMDGNGKHARVLVAESRALLLTTKGARDDVAARWAAKRGEEVGEGLPMALEGVAPPPAPAAANSFAQSRAESEARRSAALADQEEMTRDKMAGNLIAREDVDTAMRFLGAAFRSALDVMPDQVTPLVTPVTDMAEVHAILSDAGRNIIEAIGLAIQQRRAELAKGTQE